MKINNRKQRGATMVSWLVVAGLGIVAASAVVKVAPYYMEFHNVKKMMTSIASETGIKTANMRQINTKIEKQLNVNGLRALEETYYASRHPGSKVKKPFVIKRLKKGNNKRMLKVTYDVPQPWIGNLSFLINFKHAVILGNPDEVVVLEDDKQAGRSRPKLKLN